MPLHLRAAAGRSQPSWPASGQLRCAAWRGRPSTPILSGLTRRRDHRHTQDAYTGTYSWRPPCTSRVVGGAVRNAIRRTCPLVVIAILAGACGRLAPRGYVPELGELMILQQVRHTKLWFAGEAGNWPLAEYEIEEL